MDEDIRKSHHLDRRGLVSASGAVRGTLESMNEADVWRQETMERIAGRAITNYLAETQPELEWRLAITWAGPELEGQVFSAVLRSREEAEVRKADELAKHPKPHAVEVQCREVSWWRVDD